MAMMQVGDMRMIVNEGRVPMVMGVSIGGRVVGAMGMLVVLIVGVDVLVF